MSAILDLLRSTSSRTGQRLYALLDAGRSSDVLTLLYSFDVEMRSLYEGADEARLGPSGPYLVDLTDEDSVLQALLRKGWGRAWGVFFTSAESFADVRRHFRKLLMVKRASDGSDMYFRFYDPRVLSIFVPTCSAEQVGQLFGPVTEYIVECESGDVAMRFAPDAIEGEPRELASSLRGDG